MAKTKIRSGIKKPANRQKSKRANCIHKPKDEISLSLKFVLPFGVKIKIRGLDKIIQKVSRLATLFNPIVLRQKPELLSSRSNDKTSSTKLKTALDNMAKEALKNRD